MLRHTHFGEGNYDGTELVLQRLLKGAGAQITADVMEEAPINELHLVAGHPPLAPPVATIVSSSAPPAATACQAA
jgi:hypothetical protein